MINENSPQLPSSSQKLRRTRICRSRRGAGRDWACAMAPRCSAPSSCDAQGTHCFWQCCIRHTLVFLVLAAHLGPAHAQVFEVGLKEKENVWDTAQERLVVNHTETQEDTLHLINLNDHVRAYYVACNNPGAGEPGGVCGYISTGVLDGMYYINRLPAVGQLFHAYRPVEDDCILRWPGSCDNCCGFKKFDIMVPSIQGPLPSKTCCAQRSNGGARIFLMGEEITSTPSKVHANIKQCLPASCTNCSLISIRCRHLFAATGARGGGRLCG